MSETWRKIQLQMEAERQKEQKQKQGERNAEQRELEKKRKEELKDQEQKQNFNRYRSAELGKISNAKQIAISILEEIRANSSEIRQARFSDIVFDDYNEPKPTRILYTCDSNSKIYLRWGNKLKLTSEEDEIVHKYYYNEYNDKADRKWLGFITQSVNNLPEKINGEDYSEIHVKIDQKNALEIITNPDILIRNFASQLINPSRYLKTYIKGRDYWCTPPPYQEPPSPPGLY